MSKTIHVSFSIKGASMQDDLDRQAVRMAEYLYDNGLVTDTLSESAFVEGFAYYVEHGWTRDWPTEPGNYWFYGTAPGSVYLGEEGLRFATAKVIAGHLIVFIQGGVYSPSPIGPNGYWMPARAPEPPAEVHNG